MSARRAQGARVERLVAAHLREKGWRIEARNLIVGGVEVDLIAWEGQTLVFVEVRSRARADELAAALESVGHRKRARLVRAASAYLGEREGAAPLCRFDVIAVAGRGPDRRVLHVRNAFEDVAGA